MAPPTRQKPTAKGSSEADIITNRVLLNHAEATRLAKSWLKDFPFANGKDEHDTDQEEAAERELLKNRDLNSDTAGIGYHAPTSSDGVSGTRPAVTDPTTTLLRKQLLGSRGAGRANMNGQRHNKNAPPPHQRTQRQSQLDFDSDDEESRAAVGKKRGERHTKLTSTAVQAKAEQNGASATKAHSKGEDVTNETVYTELAIPSSTGGTQSKTGKKRGTGSYLDELLASRAAKKQKKDKGKSGTS